MFHTYILQSLKSGRYYIGHTQNLEERLERHQSGKVTATKNKGPWKIVYTEEFNTKIEANRRELEIKSKKQDLHRKIDCRKWKLNSSKFNNVSLLGSAPIFIRSSEYINFLHALKEFFCFKAFSMFHTYILQSLKSGRYYIGHTSRTSL
ncbi:GIY-YIG nuclease family protein [Pedobacter cryophilus]|uniref:GIY-YIG nuclease family protein n=1 Tax=Pedobacter cryophilus TaxID=2571271 RepID=A0A4U1C199_9SPHI|nr:GIY-YIG nuclease family protein [Pedobacter cryophilus]TKB97870.1 GIY-YIG nuclease family protein [Pedobacter cryophilus]